MAKYKFKFDKILSLRNKEEEQAENNYLNFKKELKEINNQLEKLELEKEEVFDDLRNNAENINSHIELRNYLKKLRSLKLEIEQQKKEKAEAVEKQFQYLMEKKKERKTLEKLKEKASEKFIKEFLASEQKELDELGIHYTTGGR